MLKLCHPDKHTCILNEINHWTIVLTLTKKIAYVRGKKINSKWEKKSLFKGVMFLRKKNYYEY